ncbi:hypothetical protein JCGZ_25090 [Jatropha curcas]|uniref:SHSP domain-containing protein n=1 Tax=Jatropha curcas TaxID=180498 RepID=A0A067JKL4_JATCU|nr:hypothetical protein JCGZ_25090 [Jatropha curcas]
MLANPSLTSGDFSIDVKGVNDFQIRVKNASPLLAHDFPTKTIMLMNPKIEQTETQNAWLYKLHVPELKQEEVTVEVEEGPVLKISGKRCADVEDNRHVLTYTTEFLRRYKLPLNAKPSMTKICFENNGLLTVTVPKHQIL